MEFALTVEIPGFGTVLDPDFGTAVGLGVLSAKGEAQEFAHVLPFDGFDVGGASLEAILSEEKLPGDPQFALQLNVERGETLPFLSWKITLMSGERTKTR